MKDLITEIVQALVDQPEEVSVNEIGGSHTTVLEDGYRKGHWQTGQNSPSNSDNFKCSFWKVSETIYI
jgi:hypothetical protein